MGRQRWKTASGSENIRMKLDKDYFYFRAPAGTSTKLKNELNGIWSAKEQSWRFPKSVFALEELEKHFPRLAEVHAWQETKQVLNNARQTLAQRKKEYRPISGDNLRDYQRQDVQYLTSIPCAGIFNQPRTGKTPTMIEVIKARKTKKNIIICPAALQYNWKREIEQWYPSVGICMYSGTPTQRKKALVEFINNTETAAFLIMSKDTAKRDLKELTEHTYDVCVVDESHYLRNRDTAQTKAIVLLGKQAQHRYALTGTPTVKHPSDVFGILHFLYPQKFTSYWQFVERYFHVGSNGFGREIGAPKKHREAELKDIIDSMTTQRLRKDVMKWLPRKHRTQHTVQMENSQQKIYKQMAEDFIIQHEGVEVDTQNALTQLLRLRQITLDPRLLGLDIPSAKTDALLELLDTDEPIIIMSMFTSYLKLLEPEIKKMGKRIGMIHGEMTNKEKNDTAQAFQAGKIDVLLCNIISAGTGFTLDKGEVIIFTDKAWNPSDNEQAEDRITPTQQDRIHAHTIVSLACEYTIDAYIEKVLSQKQNLTALINELKSLDTLRTFLYN